MTKFLALFVWLPALLPLLLPLSLNLVIAVFFLATLRRGKTPLITAMAMIDLDGKMPPGLAEYTRRLTAVWGVIAIALGAKRLLLEWPQEWWLLAIIADPVAIAVIFLLEFAWRIRRFPGCPFAAPWKLARLIRQRGGMYRLYRQCMA